MSFYEFVAVFVVAAGRSLYVVMPEKRGRHNDASDTEAAASRADAAPPDSETVGRGPHRL